jgi:hydroxybutyrate-dimer hydrolase
MAGSKRAADLAHVVFALVSCAATGVSQNAHAASPVFHTAYDGVTNDLLTAGLGANGLGEATFPVKLDDPLHPSADELRKLSIYNNYRALVDPTAGGGYGTLYGPNVLADGTVTAAQGMIAGDEYIAFDATDSAGRQNVTLMVQIPASFDPKNACLITAPSSGSRGIYGAIATAGEWGLKHGCAVTYTDKGSGIGAHDLQNNLVNEIQGRQISAPEAGRNAIFTSELSGARLPDFNAANPNRFAFKHAHSMQNPEKDWGKNVLSSIRFAFRILGEKYGGAVTKRNTIVIASSVSNGGGASLRAAEQDTEGLIDGVAVGEPNVNPVYSDAFAIQQGSKTPLLRHSRPLIDYITLVNVYQGCANAAPANATAPLNASNKFSESRCASLHEKGLLKSPSLIEQADEAQNIINDYGVLPEQNPVQPGYWLLSVPRSISVTYANAYSRSSISDNLCNFSFAPVAENRPAAANGTPAGAAAEAQLFGTSSGIPPAGIIALVNNAADEGPAEDRGSQTGGAQDQNLNGALCLRAVATGNDPVNGSALPPSNPLSGIAARVSQGVAEILATGRLHGKPAVIVTGRNDGILPPNFTSRAYYGLNKTQEAEQSKLYYYEVTNAHHLDTVNQPLFGSKAYAELYVPLHRYYILALDLMYDHLRNKTALPPSQVVRTKPRGSGAPQIAAANVPPIARAPAEADRIGFTRGKVFIPE